MHKFFSVNVRSFAAIAEAIDNSEMPSSELRRIAQTIRAASKDSKHLCDDKNCTGMADALIAVDGIKMNDFAANNPREWTTIAAALNKPLVNPVDGVRTDPPIANAER